MSEKQEAMSKFLLIIVLVVSVMSLFGEFLSLTYLFIGGRLVFYMTDAIRLLGLINLGLIAFLFKSRKWAFFGLNGSLGIMTVFAGLSGRPHIFILYLILLLGLLFVYKNRLDDLK